MIAPHGTGHAFAPDGHLLRVDVMSGRWVASRLAPDLVLEQQIFGTDESVHQQIAQGHSAKGP
jgi:hypothetical protein